MVWQIATRVPSSELDFQNGRPSFTGFLSDLIGSPLAPPHQSIFTELIVWSTVCGRVMTHRQQSIVERIYNNPSQNFWDRHQWLDSVISQRTQIFLLHYPDAAEHEDPLLLFVGMLSKLSVLDLCKTMESAPWDTESRHLTGMTYKARSLTAAQEMGKLVKFLGHLSCFMVCYIKDPDYPCQAAANFHRFTHLLRSPWPAGRTSCLGAETKTLQLKPVSKTFCLH